MRHIVSSSCRTRLVVVVSRLTNQLRNRFAVADGLDEIAGQRGSRATVADIKEVVHHGCQEAGQSIWFGGRLAADSVGCPDDLAHGQSAASKDQWGQTTPVLPATAL